MQPRLDFDCFDHIRTWTDPDGNGFRLDLFDTGRTDRYGKAVLAYRFFHTGRLIFEGADYHCSPLNAIDSDEAIAGLLAFLSLKPGDTDAAYFESYTEKQISFAREHGEALSLYVEELEGHLA